MTTSKGGSVYLVIGGNNKANKSWIRHKNTLCKAARSNLDQCGDWFELVCVSMARWVSR